MNDAVKQFLAILKDNGHGGLAVVMLPGGKIVFGAYKSSCGGGSFYQKWYVTSEALFTKRANQWLASTGISSRVGGLQGTAGVISPKTLSPGETLQSALQKM